MHITKNTIKIPGSIIENEISRQYEAIVQGLDGYI